LALNLRCRVLNRLPAVTACAWLIGALVPGIAGAQLFSGIDYSGAELFAKYCAACHGEEGRGDGPVAASLVKVVPDLTGLARRANGRFPALEVAEIIDGRSPVVAHGTRRMPVWGAEFWIEEGGDIEAESRARQMIARLIDYLESIQIP
jgi:mono/diheme cytochrome c family protein